MANPVPFKGQSGILSAPKGHEGSIRDLPTFRNGQACVSCWELTEAEMKEVIFTRRVWLGVFGGVSQPPVILGSEEVVREVVADTGPVWKK